jgi:hypothetical protein
VITTRSFIAQRRGTVLRYLRAYVRGMHRFKSDREFAKKTYDKFAQITDDSLAGSELAGICQPHAAPPRPTIRGIQQVRDSGTIGKVDVKPERLVDFSLVDELAKSGFIDAVYKE